MDYQGRITIDPEARFGKPGVRGRASRLRRSYLYLASGRPEDETLSDFPQLTREDIGAGLAFAAERECRVVSSRQADQSGRLLLDENLAARFVAALADDKRQGIESLRIEAPAHLAELRLTDRLLRTYNVGT